MLVVVVEVDLYVCDVIDYAVVYGDGDVDVYIVVYIVEFCDVCVGVVCCCCWLVFDLVVAIAIVVDVVVHVAVDVASDVVLCDCLSGGCSNCC